MIPSIAAATTRSRFRPLLPVSGGSGLAAPLRVQVILQGQDQQEQSNGGLPQNANHMSIGWKSVAGATSYNIYRSVDKGTYSFYANVTATTAASNYSTYVTNSSTYDYVNDIDCAYQDTSATNCVGSYGVQVTNGTLRSPGSGGVWHQPDANGTWFMPNVGYTYKVSAVNASGEGTISPDCIAVFFANGKEIHNHQNGWFNGNLVIADTTCPATSPLGYTTNVKWTTDSTYTYVNPFTGSSAVDGNFSVKGFNYIIMNIYSAQTGGQFTIGPELLGDTTILTTNPNITSFGTLTANAWSTVKIPLSSLLIDQIGGTNAPQYDWYKVTIDSHTSGQTYWLEWYWSVT